MKQLFNGIYKGKTVLMTGHTGFKGSWLSLWLHELGARIIGYALDPPTQPNHFDLLNLDIVSIIADIRDKAKIENVVRKYRPEIVFHLAAQPLVRDSYIIPHETYETNIMGTVNLFEAIRKSESVRAILNITSDKCYENREWVWGYRENDPIGGYDPYSSSKGCSELITNAYRKSFFNNDGYGKSHQVLVASCRAGNVIGGGDWAKDRLIPDIVKTAAKGKIVTIRNPHATRPWQHVLEPLHGYLLLGQKLLEGRLECAEAWNFGPQDDNVLTVETLLRLSQQHWNDIKYRLENENNQLHEASLLKLDVSKATSKLKLKSVWSFETSIEKTVCWYKYFYKNKTADTINNLKEYVKTIGLY